MRTVVTGGAGFIGSTLVEQLLNQGHEVMVIDDFSTGHIENLEHLMPHDRLKVHRADIMHYELMLQLFKNVDYVFHLATKNVRLSLLNPTFVHDVNTTGTLNVLKASAANNIKRFLYCSSSEVNGTAQVVPMQEDYLYKPETIYGASKLTGEYYAQVFQRSKWLDTVIARPHNNYGPREHYEGNTGEVIPRFILQALSHQNLTVFGDGAQTRDFTYVDETASILMALLFDNSQKTSGEVFNVCYGQEVSIIEIAQKILKLTESKGKVVHLPSRPNDVLRLFGDGTKLKEVMHLAPKINIDEGLKRTVDWFKENVFQKKDFSKDITGANWQSSINEHWIKL